VPLAGSVRRPTTHLWKNSIFSDTSRAVAEIIMLINSIDPLAPYKVSDDLMLELVNVTALIKIDPEGAAAGACWIEIIEPLNLAKHQPRGGYLLDNRQIQMTCAKSAGVRLGDEIRLRVVR
jgi:hypothetical protein